MLPLELHCPKPISDNEVQVEAMRKFGELIGMAFQIKDDLFDYTDDAIGKPTGIDIKEQKMTLPLIYALNNCTSKEKSWCINSIKNHNKDKKRVKEVIQFVKDKNGLHYAEEKMVQFQQEALQLLEKFPQSEYRDALSLMVNYVIDRKKYLFNCKNQLQFQFQKIKKFFYFRPETLNLLIFYIFKLKNFKISIQPFPIDTRVC